MKNKRLLLYAFYGNNSLEIEVVKETRTQFFGKELVWKKFIVNEKEMSGFPDISQGKIPNGKIKVFNKNNLLGWEEIE